MEKTTQELRRLEDVESQSRDTRKLKEENEKYRDKLEKAFIELESLRKSAHYDQETFDKIKDKLLQRETEAQTMETKLHEATLQLERSRAEITRLMSNQVRLFYGKSGQILNDIFGFPGSREERTRKNSH